LWKVAKHGANEDKNPEEKIQAGNEVGEVFVIFLHVNEVAR